MNFRFILFTIFIAIVTLASGYYFEIINYHNNDPGSWMIRLVVLAVCFICILISLMKYFAGKQGMALLIILFTVMLCWPLALYAGYSRNLKTSAETKNNAHQLILALYNYKSATNKFPDQLRQLVPKYIAAIPKTSLGIRQLNFEYFTDTKKFSLGYEDCYNINQRYESENKIWEKLDQSFK